MKQKIVLTCMLLFLSILGLNAQEEVTIQTSAECQACKERIEEALIYTKGVKYAELDLHTMVITVGYSPKKITLDEIKQKISNTGYDADDVKANPESFNQLPACCKPGGMEKEEGHGH